MPNARGVDVSHHVFVTDWAALVASGRSFIGIKATQGTGFVDPKLAAHRDGFRATSGLLAAVYYHYPDPANAPEAEAAHFVAALGPLRDDELLAQDVEQGPTGKGAPPIAWQQRFDAALPKRYRQADGRLIPNGVYTATHVWNEIGNPPWPDATAGNVFLWLKRYAAEYGACPSPWSFPTFWQDSEAASVPGVSAPCDTDQFCLGDVDELRKQFPLAAP